MRRISRGCGAPYLRVDRFDSISPNLRACARGSDAMLRSYLKAMTVAKLRGARERMRKTGRAKTLDGKRGKRVDRIHDGV